MSNRNIENEVNKLRKELEPLTGSISVPETLISENIMTSNQNKPARSKIKRIVARAAAIAAAVVLAVTGAFGAYRLYNKPKVKKIPALIAGAETPVSGNTKETVVEYFTALKAQYEDERSFSLKGAFSAAKSAVQYDGEVLEESSADMASTNGAAIADDYGVTNNQVENVDEYDIIKNDGKYLYIITNNTLRIIDVQRPEDMSTVAEMAIEPERGFSEVPMGLYLCGDRLILLGSKTDRDDYDFNQSTVKIYNISDKSDPKLIKTFAQDGDYFSSRLTDSKLILLSRKYTYLPDLKTKGGYVEYDDVVPSTSIDGSHEESLPPEMITILPEKEPSSTGYLVISALDLKDPTELKVKTSAVLGNSEHVYCNEKTLYVAATEYIYPKSSGRYDLYRPAEVFTRIYDFDITLDSPVLKNEGKIDGYINNQFSMDEYKGYFRIASTVNGSGGEESNVITVLDADLKKESEITDIARNETIRSVRFIGDYGYVVTFERTDPLFVIDFTNPKKPFIAGEVQLPGFSSYLHPVDGYLVGIGEDGDDDGINGNLKVSLFDISDPTNPKETDRIIIANARTDVGYDHKGVMVNPGKSIIGFPYSTDIYTERGGWLGTDGCYTLIRIENGKLKRQATFTNYNEEEIKSESETVYTPDEEYERRYVVDYDYRSFTISRATYIGDTIFTLSDTRLCAYPLAGGKMLGKAELES